MPEGDSLHRAAQRLQVLVGERVEVETPHPRAAVKGLAERLDGRRLEQVEAVGKNLLLHFEGGLVLRSHLRMNGPLARRAARGGSRRGSRGSSCAAPSTRPSSGTAPCSSSSARRGAPRLGPDILGEPPDFDDDARAPARRAASARSATRCSTSGSSPGSGTSGRPRRSGRRASRRGGALDDVDDSELRAVLDAAHTLMRTSVDGPRPRGTSTGAPAGSVRRCGGIVRSAPAGRATPAPPTGVPAAR